MYGGMGGKPPPLSKRIFAKYDKDGSGSISSKEFRSLVYDRGYALTDNELTMALQVLDSDGSGAIEYKEFAAWWQNSDRFEMLKLSDEEEARLETATQYFAYFDKDKSGTIDHEEFKALHADLSKNGLTTKTVDQCLVDLDADRNGKISFNEYVAWLVRCGSLKRRVLPA